jgi:plasmid maintenance system killer protein
MTSINTLNQVERACAQLHHAGQAITFTAVAARTDLGRTTLYRDPTLRAVIEEHRHRSATSGTLASLTDQIATLRTALAALDALATRVCRHEEQLRRLESRKG